MKRLHFDRFLYMFVLTAVMLFSVFIPSVVNKSRSAFTAVYADVRYPAGYIDEPQEQPPSEAGEKEDKNNFIKWVEFNVPYEILSKAYQYKLKHGGSGFDFLEALSYVSCKNGNKFSVKRDLKKLDEYLKLVKDGEEIKLRENKYFKYYKGCYGAVFGGSFASAEEGGKLKCYFPLAKGYGYGHYDDFGNARSFGFKRRHLGHDIMGALGTPLIAVEGGTVAECGWNRYGGWRVGIRSDDGKRYYYYAHLRKNKPYADGIEKGARVEAGQHIGYLGVTGYSSKENKNMNTKPHLHLGLQLIFDESQLDGNGEIWINLYSLTKFWARYANYSTIKRS